MRRSLRDRITDLLWWADRTRRLQYIGVWLSFGILVFLTICNAILHGKGVFQNSFSPTIWLTIALGTYFILFMLMDALMIALEPRAVPIEVLKELREKHVPIAQVLEVAKKKIVCPGIDQKSKTLFIEEVRSVVYQRTRFQPFLKMSKFFLKLFFVILTYAFVSTNLTYLSTKKFFRPLDPTISNFWWNLFYSFSSITLTGTGTPTGWFGVLFTIFEISCGILIFIIMINFIINNIYRHEIDIDNAITCYFS